jgi:phosphoserine phosphatase
MKATIKLVCFDCDSTLSGVEGIDELARVRGPDVLAQVQAMTADAMNGAIPVEAVFARRLEIIRPRAQDAAAVGRRYVETAEPAARAALAALRARQWTPVIVSGGFRTAIRPLAGLLGIQRIEAVDLFFDGDGNYRGYDAAYPTTRSGGKVEVIRRLREELQPSRIVMVGDAVSDLEVAPVVDLFVGFGRYVARERVQREAGMFITSLDELPAALRQFET